MRPPLTRLQAHGLITAASFLSYIAGQALAGAGGAGGATLLAMGGVASCGWAWLLARALFDPADHDARWPRVVVAIVWLTGIGSIAMGGQGLVGAVADNGYTLSGSAALLLTFVEPLQGAQRALSAAEKRFRGAFLAVFTVLVAASILLLREPGEAGGLDPKTVKTCCALLGLAAAAAAIWYRGRHPLAGVEETRRAATADDLRLAGRIAGLLRDEALHASPELKVGDLARRLGEPEYRVTRAITAGSGFANFNRLINHHRVAHAKRLLSDCDGASILVIAFECGFASLGPFNRAFKAQTGLTPRAYRALAAQGRSAA